MTAPSADSLKPPPATFHLWRLDAVRGAAAAYVAAGHVCREQLPNYAFLHLFLSFGQEAVMVFFLLSGFVIHWSVAEKPHLTLARYFSRRALRIYPLFLLTLLLTALIGLLPHSSEPRLGFTTLLGNIAMLQDFCVVKPGGLFDVYGGVTVLWSLSYEWWFYMLYFPISRFVAPGWQPKTVAALSLSQIPILLAWPNFASRVLLYFCIWWMGVELARWHRAPSAETRALLRQACYTVAVAALFLGLNTVLRYRSVNHLRLGVSPVLEFRHLAAALGIVSVALVWHRCRWTGFRFLFGGFVALAPISYALYLLHEPLGVHLPWSAWIPSIALRLPAISLVVVMAAIIGERLFQPAIRRLFA